MGYDIQTAVNLGADQLSSQFAILFPEGLPNFGDPISLALRMDQSFDPPERGVGTYDYYFQGLKITRTNAVEQTEKKFTLSFRVDQNWLVWVSINGWFKEVYDEINGTFRDDDEVRRTVVLQAFGPGKIVKQQFTFGAAKPITIKPTPFEPNGEEPSRVETGFIYHTFKSLI